MTTETDRDSWCVRVLNGPLRGATIPIDSRLTIGRASSSDVQIVHDGISRQHAKIITDERGRHMLVDLDSGNGTFVHGRRVQRHLLSHGTVFKIISVKLVYERLVQPAHDTDDSGLFVLPLTDGRTLRGTVDYAGRDPQHIGSYYGDPADSDAPVRPRNSHPVSAPAVQARGEERHRIVATRGDGSHYEGNLLDDIVQFRMLRNRARRGESPPREEQAISWLSKRLVARPMADVPTRRKFERFACHFPAKLRFADGSEISAAVVNLGVDGAKLRAYDHRIGDVARVWLAVHLVTRGRAQTVVFNATVAWTADDELGIAFSGNSADDDRKDTMRTQIGITAPPVPVATTSPVGVP